VLFRSSQSRRFFSDGKAFQNIAEGRQEEDVAKVFDDGMTNLDPMHFLANQYLPFEGLDIPIREDFDDCCDDLDGFEDDRPGTVMGASLFAGHFDPMQSVIIPTLPRGRCLVFNCVSTWGDENFVGLAGIEVFDGRGFPVILKEPLKQVLADPHSINILPEYQHDPRTPDKLFDQVNLTRDDLHVWLAPFFPGRQAHTIQVDLEHDTSLSMLRIWNYNKSRLHSSRGVRDMEVLLDGTPIFVGEIRRAPGALTAPEEACEHILFTHDESVLRAIEEHDWLPAYLPVEEDDESAYGDAAALDAGPRRSSGGAGGGGGGGGHCPFLEEQQEAQG